MKWLVVGGLAVGILLIGATAFFTWRTIAESRRKARAEEAVHTALKQWCSDEPLDQVRDTKGGDFFDEFYSRVSTASEHLPDLKGLVGSWRSLQRL